MLRGDKYLLLEYRCCYRYSQDVVCVVVVRILFVTKKMNVAFEFVSV
jgi:hypothetical protein